MKYYDFYGTTSLKRLLFHSLLERDPENFEYYSRFHKHYTPYTKKLPFKLGLCTAAKENIPDFTPHIGWDFFVSDRFKNFLEEIAPGTTQFVDVEQVPHTEKYAKHTVMEKHWLCNFMHMIDYVDIVEDRSKPLSPETKSAFIEKAILHPENIPEGCHIFRAKSFPHHLYVSQYFKNELKQRGLNGGTFREPQKTIDMSVYAYNDMYFAQFRRVKP